MFVPQVDAASCPACPRCLAALACLKGVLIQTQPGERPVVDTERCAGCGFCSPACPYGAIVEQEEYA